MAVKGKALGYLLGAIAAASYGLNPTFALPLYADGMNPDSVLLFGSLLFMGRLAFGVAGASKSSAITKHLTRFRQMFPKLRKSGSHKPHDRDCM